MWAVFWYRALVGIAQVRGWVMTPIPALTRGAADGMSPASRCVMLNGRRYLVSLAKRECGWG